MNLCLEAVFLMSRKKGGKEKGKRGVKKREERRFEQELRKEKKIKTQALQSYRSNEYWKVREKIGK